MTDSEVKPPSIMNIALKYGLFSAGIGILLFLALTLSGLNAFDQKMNWVNMAISIVLIVLAQREFKNQGDGFMSYAQGFKIGFLMSVVGMIVGGLFNVFYMNVIDPTVMDAVWDQQRIEMENNGMSDEQIDMGLGFAKKFFWPIFIFFGLFFSALMPVIVTIFTQKKNPEPI